MSKNDASKSKMLEKLGQTLERVKELHENAEGQPLKPAMQYGKFHVGRDLAGSRLLLTWSERTSRMVWEGKAPLYLEDIPVVVLALLDSYQAVFEHVKAEGQMRATGQFPIAHWVPVERVAEEMGVKAQDILDFVEHVKVLPAIDGSDDLVLVKDKEAELFGLPSVEDTHVKELLGA